VFRIRHAAKIAGITPGLLRAWERRYHLVEPTRTASGYRVYSDADVALLTATARLVAAGHSISEVARLPAAEIHAAAAKLPLEAPPASPARVPAGSIDDAIATALEAVSRFDRERFEQALLPVLSLGAMAPAVACDEVLLPLLRAMGDAWERGTLSVAAEHFGSGLVRAKILQYLQFVSRAGQGPRLVCACPENERHEGGLLAFAVHAAGAGWDVIYLGASTPVGEALDTAVRLEARAVAFSFTADDDSLDPVLTALMRFSAARRSPLLIAGGRCVIDHRAAFERAGVRVAENARAAIDELRAEADRKEPPT
jgi:DNA-binding transcriptional MerR regulator/methylmalonyl-CoA mutase cobalamin-binding subunit